MYWAAQGVAWAVGESGRTGFFKAVENKSKAITQTWKKNVFLCLFFTQRGKKKKTLQNVTYAEINQHGHFWGSVADSAVCAPSDPLGTVTTFSGRRMFWWLTVFCGNVGLDRGEMTWESGKHGETAKMSLIKWELHAGTKNTLPFVANCSSPNVRSHGT